MSQPPAQRPPFPAERAFVVQFRAEAALAQGHWVGRVEHVVSGQATHFDTPDALLVFMAQVLTTQRPALDRDAPTPAPGPDPAPATPTPAPPRPNATPGQADRPEGAASSG